MGGKRSKLIILAIYATLTGGALFLSGDLTHADSETANDKRSDILKRLENYRSWNQIKKPEGIITTANITLATIEIASSSAAG